MKFKFVKDEPGHAQGIAWNMFWKRKHKDGLYLCDLPQSNMNGYAYSVVCFEAGSLI